MSEYQDQGDSDREILEPVLMYCEDLTPPKMVARVRSWIWSYEGDGSAEVSHDHVRNEPDSSESAYGQDTLGHRAAKGNKRVARFEIT